LALFHAMLRSCENKNSTGLARTTRGNDWLCRLDRRRRERRQLNRAY
jgi:hypothetical protein